MEESELEDRLDRIARRQRLALVLLVVPYLLGIAELTGYWTAGVLYTALGLVVGGAAFYHRRSRTTVIR